MGKPDVDERDRGNPYASLDKSVVFQEARAFNESPINPKKCRLILTKIIYLLQKNQVFHVQEATEVFFSITKLFQNPDVALRQMVYLAIKELSKIAEDVIMVTSSLTKDMNAKQDLVYRPNAIRALCKITDASMMQGIERFIKQSIVDRNPSVSSAALVSAFHLFNLNKEVVKRWANEVQEACNSKGPIAQYHAIGLLYQMRQHDKMAIMKMIQTYCKGSVRSPHALCLLIRYIHKLIEEDPSSSGIFYEYLEGWLRNKNDMVTYEAARAICNISNITPKELFPAVSALQLMLVNHKAVLRFAAVRTLNKLAMTQPLAVFPCNLDMENLITDSNRSIATFAITTLLKTGNEESVDRLMKQISGFMHEISDEFKIIVVEAIRSLCLKFPNKQNVMLTFLSGILRDEGGYEFKRAIVDAVFDIVHAIPETKDFAMSHLCEFIEDCDYSKLAVRILHLLGAEGPKTTHPSKYIRYIYNRVILETSVVRAAAVSALAQFACYNPETKGSIIVLLERCTDDMDDEVRDRAAMYLEILNDQDLSYDLVMDDSAYSWASLEHQLEYYCKNPSETPFDISSVPLISKDDEKAETLRIRSTALETVVGNAPQEVPAVNKPAEVTTSYSKQFEAIPELAALGPIFKSSSRIALTEQEAEYMLFECKNTLNDILLENVAMEMVLESSEDDDIQGLIPQFIIPADTLAFDVPDSIYVVYNRSNGVCPTGSFSCTLKFVQKDCDPDTGEADDKGYDDVYQVENVDLYIGDYILGNYVPNFETVWQQIGDQYQLTETYILSDATSIKESIQTICDQLGMQPTDRNVKEDQTAHQLSMAGTFLGGIPVVGKCRMVFDPSSGLSLELTVRSPHGLVSQKVVNGIQ